jgi:hypothetical protein
MNMPTLFLAQFISASAYPMKQSTPEQIIEARPEMPATRKYCCVALRNSPVKSSVNELRPVK